ncbi:GPI mannosyltransferase 2 isoform X2 [Momordica charantia]|uniref:GPI mannosyltransferase 2 n=1 Tax=Momordica charantia TaxID=3673 RepID=A0A6J1DSV2_MOMCH|nr:GPI mannosyltransferase 2 isoform X2 [Momordica charantia]
MAINKPAANSGYERIVLASAMASRLLLLFLIIFWRALLSPYDTSASLNPTCLIDPSSSPLAEQPALFPAIGSAIESSIVWDGVYFVRIAQCGYEYEKSYAFLPLLPLCISLLSRTVLSPLVPVIGHRAVLGLSGYVINNIAFVLAARYLFRLSLIILKDAEAAMRASILFCFNPASIFYSSLYTESLYSLFSFGGLYHLMSGRNSVSALWLALSGCARSNGVLNAGYICFLTMHWAYDALCLKKCVLVLITGAFHCLCIFGPFVVFQAYGYYNICSGRLPDELRPWCKARVPLLYNFVQSHYWGVGFLRYFQFKQLPNFLLASPILSLASFSIAHYAKSKPKLLLSVGFQAAAEDRNSAAMLYFPERASRSNIPQPAVAYSSRIQGNQNLRRRKQIIGQDPADLPVEDKPSMGSGYFSAFVLPFILHTGFMAATAFFVMHVQVATRFLSASPPLYWFASYIMVSPGRFKRWGYVIWSYSVAYILLGSLLFSNFYPFT